MYLSFKLNQKQTSNWQDMSWLTETGTNFDVTRRWYSYAYKNDRLEYKAFNISDILDPFDMVCEDILSERGWWSHYMSIIMYQNFVIMVLCWIKWIRRHDVISKPITENTVCLILEIAKFSVSFWKGCMLFWREVILAVLCFHTKINM